MRAQHSPGCSGGAERRYGITAGGGASAGAWLKGAGPAAGGAGRAGALLERTAGAAAAG